MVPALEVGSIRRASTMARNSSSSRTSNRRRLNAAVRISHSSVAGDATTFMVSVVSVVPVRGLPRSGYTLGNPEDLVQSATSSRVASTCSTSPKSKVWGLDASFARRSAAAVLVRRRWSPNRCAPRRSWCVQFGTRFAR